MSADDLMAPLPEDPRLGGAGPFVINLSTSAAPLELPDRAMVVGGQAHAYLLQRVEDKRVRYRLRLGPFATEDAAIAVLAAVRQTYPAALTATADTEDMRAIAGVAAKANARPAKQTRSQPAPAVPAKQTRPHPAPAVPAKQTRPQPAPAVPATPAHRRVEALPESPAPRAALHPATPARAAAAKGAVSNADNGAAPWYVVELATAEKPFTPAALPPLDIFSLYRLYSLAGVERGRTLYVLRLGFFSDEAAAATIAKYVASYFDAPTVRRVSVAERERFAVQRAKANEPAGAAVPAKSAPRP